MQYSQNKNLKSAKYKQINKTKIQFLKKILFFLFGFFIVAFYVKHGLSNKTIRVKRDLTVKNRTISLESEIKAFAQGPIVLLSIVVFTMPVIIFVGAPLIYFIYDADVNNIVYNKVF